MAYRIAEKLAAKKAAIYIRVSTHWQVDKDSLKVQRRELIAYVTLVLGITDYVVFEDPGYSAKNTDRPEYQAMMDRIRTGEFTHLVVWKIDRISRNLIDFAAMHDELQSLGVTFVSKNEQFDTSSAIGEVDAGEHVHQRCFAAAVFAEQRQDLALVQLQVNGIVCRYLTKPLCNILHPNCAFRSQGGHPFFVGGKLSPDFCKYNGILT